MNKRGDGRQPFSAGIRICSSLDLDLQKVLNDADSRYEDECLNISGQEKHESMVLSMDER